MKNIIFLITIVALFAFGVPNYVIRGTFEDMKEGVVYLKAKGDDGWKIVDSTVIRDGQFEFKGAVVKKVETYSLELKDNNTIQQTLFVENGTITVQGNVKDADIRIGGTPNNDALNDYLISLRPVVDEIKKVMKDAETTWLGGDTTRGDYYAKLFIEAREKFPVVRSAFATKYNNLDFGVFLLVEMAQKSTITTKQVDSLIKLVPPSMKNSPYYARLEKRLEEARIFDYGVVAPDIALPTPEGEIVALSSLRGKYVLLDFWASWCAPCRAEVPHLMKSYEKYSADGFDIYSVSLDSQKEAWTKAINETGMTWMQVSDLKGMKSPAAKLYAVSGIPATWLLDKEGKIIAKDLRGKELDAKLKEIFGH